ncbi:MAG: hypothetical protein KKA05_08020 [Alphaproteobacteria bacterium]|nr:hypothetical protein [Alphaproteobacteria bacterium]
MARKENKWLGGQFLDAVGRGFNKMIDLALDAGPNVYQPSQWKEPAIAYNDTPTDELIAGVDADKVIHLHEYYKIADALSWEIGKYFISKRDTATFLMPFSSDLSYKASRGEIESWHHAGNTERRRDIHFIRVGDLMDHIAENPLPGDNWHVKTQGKGPLFAGELKNRPLQIRKLMVLSAVLATDQRATISANPDTFDHIEKGTTPTTAAPRPTGPLISGP